MRSPTECDSGLEKCRVQSLRQVNSATTDTQLWPSTSTEETFFREMSTSTTCWNWVGSRMFVFFSLHVFTAERNAATNLNIYFNATGEVQLSVSRCKYSPRLKLFKAAKLGSFMISDEVVYYMMDLYDKDDCVSDLQVERYEYRGRNRGWLNPLKTNILSFFQNLPPCWTTRRHHWIHCAISDIWQENDLAPIEWRAQKYEAYVSHLQTDPLWMIIADDSKKYQNIYVHPGVIANVVMDIPHLLERVRKLSHNSFRFHIDCTGPCEFSFTKCGTDEVQDWKKLTPLNNISNDAWYTFDRPAVEYIHALSESPDCERKNGAQWVRENCKRLQIFCQALRQTESRPEDIFKSWVFCCGRNRSEPGGSVSHRWKC